MPKPPQQPAVGPTSVQGFLKTVLRSRLLSREALQDLLRTMPLERRDDPEAVADHLIKAGGLTRFQARKLLRGAAAGLVLGPFHVLAPIARGGMGTVYLAQDVRSKHHLALKILPPRRAREEERLLARFRREMEMCQRVSHPHLAWTYEVGVHRGVYYIAMEYIPGRSLARLVAEDGPLPVPRAARLFAEVALALDHAHNQGLIHRDLKPSNIIVTPNDHAKVLDLGLALMEGERKGVREVVGGQGYVLGTMDYIAPEQTDDPSKVDVRCDVYALGCTLYFALTGRPPFPGGTAMDKILRHRTEEPVPVEELSRAVPPGVIDLLRRMMAKDPQDRPPSAAVVRHELLAWADKGPGLPLDRPEDEGYRQWVALLEAKEPSSELVAEAIPAPSGSSPDQPAPEDRPPRPRRVRPAAVVRPPSPAARSDDPGALPAPPAAVRPPVVTSDPDAPSAGLLFIIPVAAGLVLGGLIVGLLWLFFF